MRVRVLVALHDQLGLGKELGAAGVVVVQVRQDHEIDIRRLEAERVEAVDQQILVGEARKRIVAHEAGYRPRRHARVEEHVTVGGLDQPAGDRDLRGPFRVLAVEQERARSAHESVLERVERLDRHGARDSSTRPREPLSVARIE